MFRSLLIANASKKGGGGLLPDGYTQLEYIASTGTQYIDTGIVTNENYTYEADFKITDGSGVQVLFGSRSSYGVSDQLLLWVLSPKRFDRYKQTETLELSTAVKYNFISTPTEYKLTSLDTSEVVGQGALSKASFEGIYNVYLFARNETNLPIQNFKGNVYSYKVLQDNKIIQNFIPCKNPSGEVGMYDLVSKQFFGNNGTGSFVAGPEIVELPSGYKSIPSVYSNGDYFLTGIKTSQDIKVTVTFKTTQIPKFLFGVRDGSLKNGLAIYLNGSSNFVAFGGGLTSYPTTVNTANGKYHTIILSETEYTIDGEEQTRSNVVKFTDFYEIGCGALVGYDGNPDGRNFIGHMSEFKLENSNGILMDLKPVVREEDGTVGFYDIISKNFFTGANGEFSIGD